MKNVKTVNRNSAWYQIKTKFNYITLVISQISSSVFLTLISEEKMENIVSSFDSKNTAGSNQITVNVLKITSTISVDR